MPDTNAWRPCARWPWNPSPDSPTPSAASRAPDLAEREASEGLTLEVAWAFAARTPDLLGPLLDAPGFRPLSLSGGRLLAAAFDAPLDPAWAPWLTDLLHVQTDLPEVCAALPSSVRSLHTRSLACIEALDVPARAGLQVWTDLHADQIDPEHLTLKIHTKSIQKIQLPPYQLPLLELAPELWLCWDRGDDQPCAVDTNAERLKHATPQVAALPGRPAPAWVIPQDAHHPALLDAHSVLRGGGWAASVTPCAPRAARVLGRAAGRWGLLVPYGVEEDGGWLQSLLWLWTHDPDPERAMAAREASDSTASLATIERLSPGEARLRWLGGLGIYRLRGGALTLLNAPHTRALGHAQVEPDSLDIALLPDDRLLIADTNVMLRRGHLLDLALLAQDDVRPGVEAAAHALHALEDCALLVLTPDAWVEVDPAWQPRLRPTLQPFAPLPILQFGVYEQPGPPRHADWILAFDEGEPQPAPPPDPRWLDAAQGLHLRGGAFEHLPCKPGMTVELTSPGCCFRFDGEAWQPVQRPRRATFLAEGELSFPEDLHPLEDVRDLWSFAAHAAQHDRPHQARWLRLLAQQRAGQRVQGLALAAAAVSTPFKAHHKDTSPGLDPLPYPTTEDDLIRHPKRYDGVWVRYRGLVRSLLEYQNTAGAWFTPPADIKLPFNFSIANVEGFWICSGMSQGHFGQYASKIIINKYEKIEYEKSRLPQLTHTSALPPWRVNHPFRMDGHLHKVLWFWYLEGTYLSDSSNSLGHTREPEEPFQQAGSFVLAKTRDWGLLLLEVLQLGPPEPLPLTELPLSSALPLPEHHDREPLWLRTTGTLERRDDDNWPLLNGEVRVVLPEGRSKGHSRPDWSAPGLDRWADLLAAGPLHVEVEGELSPFGLWAVRMKPTAQTPPASP